MTYQLIGAYIDKVLMLAAGLFFLIWPQKLGGSSKTKMIRYCGAALVGITLIGLFAFPPKSRLVRAKWQELADATNAQQGRAIGQVTTFDRAYMETGDNETSLVVQYSVSDAKSEGYQKDKASILDNAQKMMTSSAAKTLDAMKADGVTMVFRFVRPDGSVIEGLSLKDPIPK